MHTSGKRTFTQFQDSDNIHIDLTESPPDAKRQRLNDTSSSNRSPSPSIEIVSFQLGTQSKEAAPINSEISSTNDNKENKGDTNNSNSTDSRELLLPALDDNWINDDQCCILEHRLQNNWYHFKVAHIHQPSCIKWLKHIDLKHLNVYKSYMKQCSLSLDEVSDAQYIPKRIVNHYWEEDEEELYFEVEWKGYSQEHNSWEPQGNLRSNDLYIQYCKRHNIKPLLADFASEEEEDDDDDDTNTWIIEEVEDNNAIDKESPSYIEDIMHIESVYNAAKKQDKTFTVEEIESLIAGIDLKTQHMFTHDSHHNTHNHNSDDAKKESEIDHDLLLSKLFDIKEYFDTMKRQIIDLNVANKTQDIKTPINSKKRKKRTLFDYSFTPTPRAVKSKPKTSNKLHVQSVQIKSKTATKSGRNMRQSHIVDISEYNPTESDKEEKIPIEYIQQSCSCYSCKRKWPLYGIEYFKAFPICKECPKHIRIGYNRKFKEDWFCPYCIHSAHRAFSVNNGSMNDTSLANICAATNKPFLYVKPNGSNYWKTYIPLKVLNESQKSLRVELKRGQQKDITLADIPPQNILWCYHDKTTTIRKSKDLKRIVEVTDDMVVIKEAKKKPIKVHRSEVIHCSLYLDKLILDVAKHHKQRRLKWDRERIFKHARRMKTARKQRERAKYQFGANTKIVESAQVNSRCFDDSDSDSIIAEKVIPHYTDTMSQLLSTFGVSSVPANFVQPPRRKLLLSGISKYSLILIVGPSGCGKSTLLKDLRAQNPEMVTFKSPSCLKWDNSKCVISQFGDIPVSEAMSNMSSIGLNNVRTWLKPFNILSQGEQYRCAFARLLQQSKEEPDKIIIMDEFTSVLDRINARCMSAATSKCIRNNNLNKDKKSTFVLASANADIIRYLQPDLLVLLGDKNGMRCIQNPNNLKNTKSLLDVKTILDLPRFSRRKEDDEHEHKSIYPQTMFNDLVSSTKPINVTNEVRELKCKVMMDAHAKQTALILDVEDFNGECKTHIPCLQRKHLQGAFNIGVIVGPSGCGKTSSGERLFGRPQSVVWDNTRSIASHFKSVHDVKELFVAVDLPLNIGFSHFEYLSEGEQHRINIARYLQHDHVLIDEFTSYLDRDCAKKVAKGVSDYIYRHNKKNIVFLCCKYDIISASNGLHPSWIFDVPNKKITHYKQPSNRYIAGLRRVQPKDIQDICLYAKHEYIDIENLWNPPKIRLVLKPATKYDFAPTFSKYHYMDASISTSAKCYSVWAYFSYSKNGNNNNNKRSDKEEASDDDDEDIINSEAFYEESELELAGFISFINHYGLKDIVTLHGKKTIDYREHRTVILPAFQGLGFGSRVADCIGEYLALHGVRLHSKTAHPRYGGYRNKKPSLWIPTKSNGKCMTRTQWKKNTDRILFGNRQEAVGPQKKYFIHIYKLLSERTDEMNQKLKSRVIVNREYKKV